MRSTLAGVTTAHVLLGPPSVVSIDVTVIVSDSDAGPSEQRDLRRPGLCKCTDHLLGADFYACGHPLDGARGILSQTA